MPLCQLAVAETGNRVVVDHAHGLHMRIDDGRAEKLEPPFLQIFGPSDRVVVVFSTAPASRRSFRI